MLSWPQFKPIFMALAAFWLSVFSAHADNCAPAWGQSQWQGVVTHYGFIHRPMGSFKAKKMAGVNAIRDEVFWDQVEGADGTLQIPKRIDAFVNEALSHRITPMLVLGYGHPAYDQGGKPRSARALEGFRRYAMHVVKHFKGRVRHFEIWNEWDADTGGAQPGDPDSYVQLIQHVAPALRALDPHVCIVVGALTPSARFNGWLGQALTQGLLEHADALSLHTYNYGEGRGKDTPESWFSNLQWFIESELPRYRQTRGKSVFVSEMGWSAHPAGMDERLQAAYALRLRLLSLALAKQTANTANPYAGFWWYDWQDDGEDPQEMEHHYGLIAHSGSAKPVLDHLTELETFLPAQGLAPLYSKVQTSFAAEVTAVGVDALASHHRHPTLLAIWNSANRQTRLTVMLDEDAPRFSSACEVQKSVPPQWVIQIGAMPCLIQSIHPLGGKMPVFQQTQGH